MLEKSLHSLSTRLLYTVFSSISNYCLLRLPKNKTKLKQNTETSVKVLFTKIPVVSGEPIWQPVRVYNKLTIHCHSMNAKRLKSQRGLCTPVSKVCSALILSLTFPFVPFEHLPDLGITNSSNDTITYCTRVYPDRPNEHHSKLERKSLGVRRGVTEFPLHISKYFSWPAPHSFRSSQIQWQNLLLSSACWQTNPEYVLKDTWSNCLLLSYAKKNNSQNTESKKALSSAAMAHISSKSPMQIFLSVQ